MALRMQEVTLSYPGHPRVLDGVDLSVEKGRLVVLRGRSGSGKSSLLALAAGLERPDAGTVTILDEPVPTNPVDAARMRARHVGLVFQHLHLLPELNVAENIALPLRLRRGNARVRPRVEELLDRFGLRRLARRLPHTLSGGEQQRVAIARALAPAPDLLLVDEPTSALDEENARQVKAALMGAARMGAGVLVATHDPVFRDAGQVLHLREGRVTA